MEASDWAVSSVVFVVAVSTALVLSSHLVSDRSPQAVESQIKDILENVSDEILIRSMLLKTDCNSSLYDCNREYPVEVSINQLRHNFLSTPYSQDENKLYSIMPSGQITKLYSFPRQKITPRYLSASSLNISSDENYDPQTDTNQITINNQYLNAAVTDFNATIDFVDSDEQDLILTYPQMYMAKLKDTNASVVVGNDGNEFYLRFFPNSAEFWIDMPDDINVNIEPMQKNWKVDENTSVFNGDQWWDNDVNDHYWWHYRIPIVVHTQDYSRQDLNVRVDINFIVQKQKLGKSSDYIDPNSFRLVEYRDTKAYDATTDTYDDSLALENLPSDIEFSSSTLMADVKWTLTGFTPTNSYRVYYLYFDFLTNYEKPTYGYDTIYYTAPEPPVFITVADPQMKGKTQVFDTNKTVIFNPNTIILNTVNQLARQWQYIATDYRKPIIYETGFYDRNAMIIETDVNFAKEMPRVGCSGCELDTNSLVVVQVNNWDEGKVTEILSHSSSGEKGTFDYNYGSVTRILDLSWFVPATPAKTKRYYFLYFSNLSGADA